MKQRISRLEFLKTTGKLAAAVALSGIFKLVPEANIARAATTEEVYPQPAMHDAQDFKEALAAIQASSEYGRHNKALASKESFDYLADEKTGIQFFNFVLKLNNYVRPDAFNKATLYLFPTLVFALDHTNKVLDVFILHPNMTSMIEADQLTSNMKSLREGTEKTIKLNADVIQELKELQQSADNAKAAAKARYAPKDAIRLASNPACDCGYNKRYYCKHTTTIGGYYDGGYRAWCGAACVFVPTNVAKAACLLACYYSSWVPPYTYCDTYACSSCCSSCR